MKCSEQQAKSKAVDVEESMWALDEDGEGCPDATRSLMVSLARPAPTAEEVTWKQGEEQSIALNFTSAMCFSSSIFPGMLAYGCNGWQSSLVYVCALWEHMPLS